MAALRRDSEFGSAENGVGIAKHKSDKLPTAIVYINTKFFFFSVMELYPKNINHVSLGVKINVYFFLLLIHDCIINLLWLHSLYI